MITKEHRLGEIVDYYKGYAFNSSLYSTDGIMVVRVSDFTIDSISCENAVYIEPSDKYEKFRLHKNDILIQTVGSWANNPNSIVGKVVRVPETCSDTYLNQNIVKIFPKDNSIDNDFLFYYLKATRFSEYCVIRGQGAANQASITLDTIFRFPVKLPPLPTQQKIASILSAYDNLIQNYKKQIEALQTAASELYKEWFVRFRFPGYQTTEFENGIPKGWKVEKLFDVAKIIYGYPFNSDEFCDDSTLNPVVRIRDILDNYTNTYTSETCDEKYWINPNEMLIGMDGIFHMSLWTGKKALQNQRTVRVTSKVKNLSNYYLYFSLYPQIKALEQMIVGTTVAHLGDKHLKKITILIPEDKILKMSFERLEPMMNRIYSLQQQITNLTQQRDLLLPRLMSGKLEVE